MITLHNILSVLQAWKLPIDAASYLAQSFGSQQAAAASIHVSDRLVTNLQKEAIMPGITKLRSRILLASFTGAVAYWCLCVLQLGSHSAVGWLAAAVGGVLWLLWWVVSWVWRMLLWDPSYLLQVRLWWCSRFTFRPQMLHHRFEQSTGGSLLTSNIQHFPAVPTTSCKAGLNGL